VSDIRGLRLDRENAQQARDKKNSRDAQQRDMPGGAHVRDGFPRGVDEGILPATTHHKGYRPAFRVWRVTGTNALHGVAASQRSEIRKAQAEGLVSTGGRRGPCGDRGRVGTELEGVSRFDGGQPPEGNHPRATNVDDDNLMRVDNHTRMPVQQPRTVRNESQQRAEVQCARQICADNEATGRRQHQGSHHHGHNAPKDGTENGLRLLHAVSMTHAEGGEAYGNAA